MLKFYVHYEGDPDFTQVVVWTKEEENFEELLKQFVSTYNFKFPQHELNASNLEIVSERKKKFKATSKVFKEVKKGDDLFVVPNVSSKETKVDKEPIAATSTQSTASSGVSSSTPEKKEDKKDTVAVNNNNKNKSDATPTASQSDDAEAKANAAQLLRLLQQTLAGAEDSVNKGKFRAAVSLYEQILEYVPSEKNSLHHLGEIWSYAHKYDKAIEYFTRGVKAHPEQLEFHLSLGDCYFAKEDYQNALKYYKSALSIAAKDPEAVEKIKVLIGKTMYKGGDLNTGIQLVQSVLQKNEENPDALLEYGIILKDRKNYDDALRVFLKLLVAKPDNEKIRENLTDTIVASKEGIKMIEAELTDTASSAAAFSYLGIVIKDFGAVEEATLLYEKSWKLRPDSVSYCLSYVHALEVLNKYNIAFQAAIQFCKQNPSQVVGTVSCQMIVDVIGDITDITDLATVRNKISTKTPPEVAQYDDEKTLSGDELDLFALWFTIVKIAHVVGALEIIPPLVKMFEPVRGKRELHLTTIRNEHAYYCCITHLMGYHHLPISLDLKPFYIIGDSHSMSTAWKTIKYKGEDRLTRSLLVTGLKIWHLRPESKFFPKHNFWNVIKTVPNGSEIVFLFGEIDCREGLVVSVEKCKYSSIEEGALATINIYIDVLLGLVKKKNLKIFVHPVVPVLNETRHIVKIFNGILKDRVMQTPKLHFLDFFDSLLDSEGGFNKEYDLDGTHLNPKYIPLLDAAIQKYE